MDSDAEFEYESDDGCGFGDEGGEGDEAAVEIENTFYEADDNKASNPALALEQFEKVVSLEKGRGEEVVWRFKALQNAVVLCSRLGRLDKMAALYEELLALMDRVTRNDASDAINTVLDAVSNTDRLTQQGGEGAASTAGGLEKLEKVYALTLKELQKTQNQRLWFNTSVKLAKLYLDQGQTGRMQQQLRELHACCVGPDGRDDIAGKGSQLLEVYALEIQLCERTKNAAKMKEIYPRTINLTSAIADPRNVAVIRESGGRMYMSEKKWTAAYNEFFEAFKNYQETGNASRAKAMLKYVVLANMLALSDINPFDSREAKVYQEDPEVAAMHQLRVAYDNNDVAAIDRLLGNPKYRILSDPLIKLYLADLLRNIRLSVLQNLVLPYRSASLQFLAAELNISREELTPLLVQLILDGKLSASIDDVRGFIDVDPQCGSLASGGGQQEQAVGSGQRYAQAGRWAATLGRINAKLTERVMQSGGQGAVQHGGFGQPGLLAF